MKRRAARYIALAMIPAVLGGLWGGAAALAAQPDGGGVATLPPAQGTDTGPIEFSAKFPSLEGSTNEVFEFEVYIKPSSEEHMGKYDFNVVKPSGWQAGVYGSYPKKLVTSIDFTGENIHSETVEVHAFATPGKAPNPGEYVLTLEISKADNPDFMSTIDLTAVVTENYSLNMSPESGRLNADVNAGKENHVSVLLRSTGTGNIEDITLEAEAPEEWAVVFDPASVDTLEAGLTQTLDLVITPPKNAIAGDYVVSLNADSENAADSIDIRVTVMTSTIWGWAGIGIAAGVIAGLVVMFRRWGRR